MTRRDRILRYFRYAIALGVLALVGFTLYLDLRVKSEFEGRRFALPARIYARPLELHVGLRIARDDVEDELRELGYATAPREAPGWYVRGDNQLEIGVRPFTFWDGAQPARRVRAVFQDGTVTSLTDAEGRDVPLLRLEPLPIGGIYPAGNEDRLLVRLKDVPPSLVRQLIVTEDRNYYTHHGFDPRGLARGDEPRFGSRAGRQHHHAAAGEELLPHAGAHPHAEVHRAPDGGAPGSALRQRRDPRDLSQRDLSRPGPRPRDPRRRPRGAVLLRQGPCVPDARGDRAPRGDGERAGGVRSAPPPTARARAAQPGAARDARPERNNARGIRAGAERPARRVGARRERHLALSRVRTARAAAAAPGLRRRRASLRGPSHLHDARSTSAGGGRACAHQAHHPIRQGQALRPTRPRGRGGGDESEDGRSRGADRRPRPALPRLQPRGGRRTPGGLAAEAGDLPHRPGRALALYAD